AGTAGATRHTDHRGVLRVRADLTGAEPSAHAAHERHQRHPRGDPRRRHDHARLGGLLRDKGGRLRGRVLRGDERGRRLLGNEPDARHVPPAPSQGQEEKRGL
ncbi:MAG: NAD(P) transhydrogenase alpha subunit, partial [uncultured Rubrobacteraceae bacterium]